VSLPQPASWSAAAARAPYCECEHGTGSSSVVMPMQGSPGPLWLALRLRAKMGHKMGLFGQTAQQSCTPAFFIFNLMHTPLLAHSQSQTRCSPARLPENWGELVVLYRARLPP
jgi:hypothetical protein